MDEDYVELKSDIETRMDDPDLASLKYSPNQPRVPAGRGGGGQFTSSGSSGGGAAAGKLSREEKYRQGIIDSESNAAAKQHFTSEGDKFAQTRIDMANTHIASVGEKGARFNLGDASVDAAKGSSKAKAELARGYTSQQLMGVQAVRARVGSNPTEENIATELRNFSGNTRVVAAGIGMDPGKVKLPSTWPVGNAAAQKLASEKHARILVSLKSPKKTKSYFAEQ